jgi:hypothetical protein
MDTPTTDPGASAPLARADRPGPLRLAARFRWAAAPVALVVASLLVWNASSSAFQATTTNGTNSWAAGTVAISDDDSGSAMFNATGLKPGDTGAKCILVTYGGSLAATVKLYSAVTGTLGQYLDLTVEQGTGGTSSGCGSFAAESTLYSGTLSGFGTAATNFANGVGSWTPGGAGATKAYRFTYTLQNNNAAQGLSASATFTWEAQNT